VLTLTAAMTSMGADSDGSTLDLAVGHLVNGDRPASELVPDILVTFIMSTAGPGGGLTMVRVGSGELPGCGL